MKINFKGCQPTNSGKGIKLKLDDINYNISYEVLAQYNILKSEADRGEYIIILDDSKEIRSKNNWFFISSINVKKIIKDEKLLAIWNQEEKYRIEKENEQFYSEVFDDKDEILDANISSIDFNYIYDNINFYHIKENKKKMSSNEKLVQKSIKLNQSKYFNGVKKITDLNFSELQSMTNDDLTEFILGNIKKIKLRKLKIPKSIPSIYKGNNLKIIDYLEKKDIGNFITKTDKQKFIKGTIPLKNIFQIAEEKSLATFLKISKTFKDALMIKRETGINPFVVAWPYLIGKTEFGNPIHAPLAYRDVNIKESLDEYEIEISDYFSINTYPILKSYADSNGIVNHIEPEHNNLQSLLQEFYKHRIKIERPDSNTLINYKNYSQEEGRKWLKNNFKLSNEIMLKIKPSDEFIYYDLRNILKDNNDFSLPESTYRFGEEIKPSLGKSFIFDIDNSKALAVKNAIKESVVIFGPPGTGKSQAITNIVGKIIEMGSNSIFVAEKETAIEVIEKNLSEIGFDDFVINLNNTSKIDFQKKFSNILK